MSTLDELLAAADARRASGGLAYAGAFTPAEALALLQANPDARLVDVRTRAELDWVGRPTLPEQQYLNIEWNRYPGGVRNDRFVEELKQAVPTGVPVLLLCRSAARSKAAAIAGSQAGMTGLYDILEGFEGDKDASGHRKTVGGWCFRGLPWTGA